MKQALRRILIVGAALAAATAYGDDYAGARADLVAAYQAEDYAAMRLAAGETLAARPEVILCS